MLKSSSFFCGQCTNTCKLSQY